MTHRAGISTLVLTDMEDSTRLVARVGDARSAAILARVDTAVRALLARHGAREIDKSDGFLLLFERPVDAVAFSLALHPALTALGAELGCELRMRVGIHLGEVLLRHTPEEEVARGAKRLEVEGLAKPLAARVMALAPGGRTLLTRAAFDLARRAAADPGLLPEGTQWIAHGPYVLKGIGSGLDEEPVEIFEVAPPTPGELPPPPDSPKAFRAIRPGEEEMLGWRPATGNEVRRRPGWVLREKLGEGGFGEVWLAEHARTRDRRVFKFCFVWERLRSLKRELTLFLLIRDTLGDRRDIQRLHDLNFDEPPFFLEMDYADGGALPLWVESRGGFAAVPMATRLELVAQVSDALAAAHSVAILHRDIKPQNILVDGAAGTPQAKLTDFGIGQLTDKSLLDRVGREGSGFTESTLAHSELSSRTGTRLYMAPELFVGKPPSIQSDIYALGVLLYQCLVGDFSRALTAEWEGDVADDLLRGDVRACVAADPQRRLASAAELATRLRTLGARREERRRRRLRRALAGTFAVLALLAASATAVTIPLLRRERAIAQREAALRAEADASAAAAREREAEAESQRRLAMEQLSAANALAAAMLEHLSRTLDMQRPQDRALATAISATVVRHFRSARTDTFPPAMKLEFAGEMGAAARKLVPLGEYAAAAELTSGTLRLYHEVGESQSPAALAAMNDHGLALREAGRMREAEAILRDVVALGERVHGPDSPLLADSLLNLGGTMNLMARGREGLELNHRALRIIRQIPQEDPRQLALALQNAGNSERDAGSLDEAIRLHRESLEAIRRGGPVLEREAGVQAAVNLANDYSKGGQFGEALQTYEEALEPCLRQFGPEHSNTALLLNNIGLMQLRLGRFEEARANARRALDIRGRTLGPAHQQTVRSAILLASIENESGNTGAALEVLAEARDAFATAEVSPDTEAAILEVQASTLLNVGRYIEGLAAAERLHTIRLSTKGDAHRMTADAAFLRAQCLLKLGREQEAVSVLAPALSAVEPALGRDHQRVRESRMILFLAHLELARTAASAGDMPVARENAANALAAIRNDRGMLTRAGYSGDAFDEVQRLATQAGD